MYVTRPLSFYKNSPESLSKPPHEGPNSGYLIIQDEDSLTPSCFSFSNSFSVKELPLPSNTTLKFEYTDVANEIFAIPVINQPLSANRYYLIKAHGKHKGEACTCSKEENKGVSCGRSYIQDEKPRPLDPENIYQQFEFNFSKDTITCTNRKGFLAKSITPDGHPPRFLRTKSPLQILRSSTISNNFTLGKANGIDSTLRAHLPDFNFPLSKEHSTPVCVGKWYCPYVFIHEGKVEDQVKNSFYYEMTLERHWERIFAYDSSYTQGNKVIIDVMIPSELVALEGKDAIQDKRDFEEKLVWFRTIGSSKREVIVGLSSLIVEGMKWEQERIGWVNKNGKQIRVVREEEYGGIGWWARFGCYVLVERFVLKRMDGSLVLTYDFKHTHQINTKWE